MTGSFVPVSRRQHGERFWKPAGDFTRARQSVLLPLVLPELVRAQGSLTIAFTPHGDSFRPVVVAGLRPMTSLLVAPDGRWLGRYVPAALRSYPFALGHGENGQKVLLVHEPDGVSTSAASGQPFFDGEKPTPRIDEILSFLMELDRAQHVTDQAVNRLMAASLIEPWPLTVQISGKAESVHGLYRIHEAALNQLGAEDFTALRQDGALLLAYAQLMSMQHIGELARLAEAFEQQANRLRVNPKGELDLEFLNEGGTLQFPTL